MEELLFESFDSDQCKIQIAIVLRRLISFLKKKLICDLLIKQKNNNVNLGEDGRGRYISFEQIFKY